VRKHSAFSHFIQNMAAKKDTRQQPKQASVYAKDLQDGTLDLSLSALGMVPMHELIPLMPRIVHLDISSNALESLPVRMRGLVVLSQQFSTLCL
jgi:hypothetical protein